MRTKLSYLINSKSFIFLWNFLDKGAMISTCEGSSWDVLIGIKRFDHKTKVKARSERQNFQTTSQLCTRHWGDKLNNRELTEGKCPKNNQNILNRNLRKRVSTRVNPHYNRIPKAHIHLAS